MDALSADILEQQGFIHSPSQLDGQLGKRFQFLSKIGEGSFGMVASAIDKETGKQVAIKKIKMSKKNEGLPVSSLREIAILKHLSHPNIVKIDDVFYNQEQMQLCFLLEYHPNNLHQYVKAKNPLTLSEIKVNLQQTQMFSYQILKSLQYIHRKGIIHRDLKPQNFLLSTEGQLRLCDFGQAKVTYFKPQKHTPDISTLWYRSPQILMGSAEYDEKVDVWSAGCTIAQLILGKPLFYATSQISLLFTMFKLLGTPKLQDFPQVLKMKDMNPNYPKFPGQGIHIESIPQLGNDFLGKMLRINPKERMSVEQLLRHNFLLGVEQMRHGGKNLD